MSPEKPEPEILHYSNYRTYLQDYYEYKKAEQPVFSHRYFARKAGITSPNYLKLVMDGKRNLTKKTLLKFATALGLKGMRAEFFENLVFFNQSASLPERNSYYGNILRVRAKAGLRKLDEAQFQLFSDWRHIVVRELAAAKGFRPDARWIAKKLGKVISEKEAEESLKLLSILGLLRKTANGFMQTDINITTSDEVRSLLVKNYHHQMIRMGAAALDTLPASRRDISSITIPIHPKDFPKLKEQIQLMRKELFNMSAEQGAGEDVIQVNIQLFPLTGLQG
ncbi:MAG TPA: TIGR02147 family protein [Fibrobacteria bacterium]|nr:TIGR02147 family protein [Fibrobacteria bacterium]